MVTARATPAIRMAMATACRTTPTTARSIRTRIRRTPTATAWAMPAIADADNDGVPDNVDDCVPTEPGAVVNAEGCAIAQICPCKGEWKNRLAYVACVARTANDFREDGLISARELLRSVLQAGKSQCGAKPKK